MLKKWNRELFVSLALFSASLVASENVTTATIVEKLLYFLRSPFLIFLERDDFRSLLIGIALLFIVIGIESYVIHRLLKKGKMFVFLRMIIINLIEQVMQNIAFFLVVLGVYLIPIQIGIVGRVLGELALVLCFFYGRVVFSSWFFSLIDSSINKIQLKKAMLQANGLSYAFLLVVSFLGKIKNF